MRVLDFIHGTSIDALPQDVRQAARRSLIDLIGVAAAGSQTSLSMRIRAHALSQFASGDGESGARLLFDGRRASLAGAALAGGMSIDAIDAHDGHKLTKGHVGCGVLPALLAACEAANDGENAMSEADFLVALVVGYEVGTRAGIALHASATDYHTSGAWIAIAAAAVVARVLCLSPPATREALGIAEYHGPRSPMMRVIDHPSMLKDGSGWGSMAGVSAALLARDGFTGAPADTVEGEAAADIWGDLGTRWTMTEQYIKVYPVCRWAQPAIAAALALRLEHAIDPSEISSIEIRTFHESARLATRTPTTTEQAQYSLPFPVAAALVHGKVGVAEIDGEALADERVLTLSAAVTLSTLTEYDEQFPARRISDVTIVLADGRRFESGPTEAPGDPESPLPDDALEAKFLTLAATPLGDFRASALLELLRDFGDGSSIRSLAALIYPPTERPRAEPKWPA